MSRVERVAPWVGLALGISVPVLAFVLPQALGWEVASRAPRSSVPHPVPPLHGYWQPTWFGPGTVPAVAVALLGWRYAVDLAGRLPWRRLLLASYAVSLVWLLSLALVTGPDGIQATISSRFEYLPSVRRIGHSPADVHHLLQTYVDRIPYTVYPHNWPTELAGHPPGMVLVFVAFAAVGLGGNLSSGLAVCAVAASIGVAVLVTLRALDAEELARRAAPFLVLSPTAVFLAVSGDAVISTIVAWGLACLALAATAAHRSRLVLGALGAGLLLGYAVLMSYGMPLMGLVALAVLVASRRSRPALTVLGIAVVAAAAVVVTFAALGFSWWEAYPVLRNRYYDGIAKDRPLSYWWWGNLGALMLSAGPLLAAGLVAAAAHAVGPARTAALAAARPVLLLVGATVVVVALADASGMSKAETERIWLPFTPWLILSCALLPERWRRWGLGGQVLVGLLVEHLLNTAW